MRRRPRRALWLASMVAAFGHVPAGASDDGRQGTGRVREGRVPGPVAVLPFRNLNRQSDLDWLTDGMAETLLYDLRREGMQVVERDTLGSALAEMALQGLRPTDESTAAYAGRMVGARTIVVGGFQTAGEQVRITARFVEVETSVILDAAMVTGRLVDILELQDEIVARLMGRPPPRTARVDATPRRTRETRRDGTVRRSPPVARKAPPAKATPPPAKAPPAAPPAIARTEMEGEEATAATVDASATLAAYQAFAMSLSSASTAEQRRLLLRALERDPGFRYAREALDALERRMQHYRQAMRRHLGDRLERLREQIREGTYEHHPNELYGHVASLLGQYMQHRLWNTALADLDWLEELTWPEEISGMVTDYLAYQRITLLMMLKRGDEAMSHAEAFLRDRPDSQFFTQVDHTLTRLIDERHRMLEGLESLPAALEALEERQKTLRREAEEAEARLRESEALLQERRAELESLPPDTREHSRMQNAVRSAETARTRATGALRSNRIKQLNLIQNRCNTFTQHRAWRQAARICGEGVEEMRRIGGEDAEERAWTLVFMQIRAYTEVGEFRQAQALAEHVRETLGPRSQWARNLSGMQHGWAADAP